MAVTLTRNFYINSGLFLFACLALALSIWAFLKPCKKDGFGDSVKTFPNEKSCVKYAKNNENAKDYCSWGNLNCNSDNDCPPHPFSKGQKTPCVCPGQNSNSCNQKVCKITNNLPYCIPTTDGKWELECN